MPAKRSSSLKISLTKSAIEAIRPPTAGRSYVRDAKVPGLVLCTTAAGNKSFYWYRRSSRGPERVHLGGWPELTVEQARDAAERRNGVKADGKSPAEAARLKRGVPTLAILFEDFIVAPTKTRSKRSKSPKTVKDYKQLWEAHLKEDWGHRVLSAITRQEIENLHSTIGHATPYLANRVLALIKAIFNRAIDTEVYNANPAARVRAFEEHSRERFVGDDEIARFMKAVQAEPSDTVRDFVLLALYTGQRRGNVQAMRWDDLNLELGAWAIPHTKTGRHTVPLTTEALAILRKRLKTRGEAEFVLPGRHGKGHLKDPMRQWKEILGRAGMEDLRIHDLRRTLGSWQAGTGSSLPVIGKTMGHSRPETTAIYSRLEMKTVRESMQTATDAITKAAKPKAKAKRKGVKHA